MKVFIAFLILVLPTGYAIAQTFPILTDQLVQPSKKQIYKDYVEYQVGNIVYYNGDTKHRETFYILDKKTGANIFEYDEEESKARHLIPKFFMTESNPDLIILCISLEGNYSWGTHVFIIDHGKVSYPGFIHYGVDNFNFASLGLYAQFEQHDDWFLMFFQEDAQIIDYETDDMVKGSEIEFKIEKEKITRSK